MATLYAPSRSKTSSPTGIRAVPLLLALPYLIFTWVLFLIGPYEWPIQQWWVVLAYVPLAFALLTAGYMMATNRPGRPGGGKALNAYFILGGVATLILLFPTAIIYTGKWPWQIGAALTDQREAYSALGQQLAETEGSRGPFAALRALLAPFSFCVLPLAVIYWKQLPKSYRLLAFLVVLVSINLSILRGTTRELADLVIIGGSAYLVQLGRESLARGQSLGAALRKRWKMIFLAPLLVVMVLAILIGRTEARLGGANIKCLDISGVCMTSAEPYNSMPDSAYFAMGTITGYFSQGYYGLSLAAEQELESTMGAGHSPAASALFVLLGGDPTFLEQAFTAKARGQGWNDATQWSTLLTWIANDVGLAGALVFVLLLGLVWGRAWMNATQGLDDRSAVFFCALMMMVFYLPANNQMMSNFDAYATLIFWGFASLFAGRNAHR